MTDEDAMKYSMRQTIASLIDHPSVYMGGPSTGSIRKAIQIINALEDGIEFKPKEEMHKDIELIKSWRTSAWDSLERK